MKSDSQIREEVIQELRWDPQVTDPDAIGVAVKDGAVTLTGAVSTYAQKFAAVRAASRVYGVKAVADELTVKPTGEPRDDSDIARAIAHILDNNTQIPEGKVHAQVRAGWVTLNGEVEWQYQRLEVERMVQHVHGVVGISNNIIVTPKVSPGQDRRSLQARGRDRRPSHQRRHLRPHREALRAGPLTERSERRKGSGRVSARHCQRGESFGRHTV